MTFPTVNFSDSEAGLFTPAEIRRLMRIEFERAVRYEYPIVCTLIEVDRLESLHDLYGYESKEEILNSVIGLMRSMTRASDFLGCMRDDRLMATFPHTHRAVAAKLADRLLHGVRKLRFDSDGRTLRATLSIGISYCEPGERIGYDEFTVAAEEALDLAIQAGGDRHVERGQLLRKEVAELRDEIDAQRVALNEARLEIPAPAAFAALEPTPPPAAPTEEVDLVELPGTALGKKLRELFEQLGPQTRGTAEIQRAIVELTLQNLQDAHDEAVHSKLAERTEQVDLLERRVRKLAAMLDMTESELARVAGMRDVDPGIASVYRSVQGLSGADRDYELKKQLMTEIFKANLELKKQREGRDA